MSSYITCKLEIKDLEMIKKVLDTLGLKYTVGDNLVAKGYGRVNREADIVVSQGQLKSINAGRYGDLGFKYNQETKAYDMIVDDYDSRLINTVKNLYALESIKEFAEVNRKSYEIVSGSVDDLNADQEIIIDVFA